jgi:hypothetical protein
MKEKDLLDEFSVEIVLERKELSELLDRALALLPPETRELLLRRYVEETPLSDIARVLNINPSAATMRLQRGKLALRRVLTTSMQEEFASYIRVGNHQEWGETTLWCFLCGQYRLRAKYVPEEKRFVFSCPICCPCNETTFSCPLDIFPSYGAGGLEQVLSQTSKYFSDYYQCAGPLPSCLFCQQYTVWSMMVPPITLSDNEASMIRWWYQRGRRFFYTHCSFCGKEVMHALENMILSIPQVQHFWSENPKMRLLPAQDIDVAGSPALVTTMKSMTSQATLTVIALQARDVISCFVKR